MEAFRHDFPLLHFDPDQQAFLGGGGGRGGRLLCWLFPRQSAGVCVQARTWIGGFVLIIWAKERFDFSATYNKSTRECWCGWNESKFVLLFVYDNLIDRIFPQGNVLHFPPFLPNFVCPMPLLLCSLLLLGSLLSAKGAISPQFQTFRQEVITDEPRPLQGVSEEILFLR